MSTPNPLVFFKAPKSPVSSLDARYKALQQQEIEAKERLLSHQSSLPTADDKMGNPELRYKLWCEWQTLLEEEKSLKNLIEVMEEEKERAYVGEASLESLMSHLGLKALREEAYLEAELEKRGRGLSKEESLLRAETRLFERIGEQMAVLVRNIELRTREREAIERELEALLLTKHQQTEHLSALSVALEEKVEHHVIYVPYRCLGVEDAFDVRGPVPRAVRLSKPDDTSIIDFKQKREKLDKEHHQALETLTALSQSKSTLEKNIKDVKQRLEHANENLSKLTSESRALLDEILQNKAILNAWQDKSNKSQERLTRLRETMVALQAQEMLANISLPQDPPPTTPLDLAQLQTQLEKNRLRLKEIQTRLVAVNSKVQEIICPHGGKSTLPLISTVLRKQKDIFDALIEGEVNPNLEDKYGWTALHCAVVEAGRTPDGVVKEMIETLLKHGARLDLKNNRGFYPHQLAFSHEVLQFVLDFALQCAAKDADESYAIWLLEHGATIASVPTI